MALEAKVHRRLEMGGGINSASAPHLLKPSESLAFRNFDMASQRGMPKRRNGTTVLNATPITGDNPIEGLFRFYTGTGSTDLLVYDGSDLYQASGTTLDGRKLASGFSGDPMHFRSFNDFAYMTNGTDEPKRWDGTDLRAMGFPKPTTKPSVAIGAAGVLTGDYQYKISFEYSNASEESSSSSATTVISLTADKASLTSIPTGNSDVTKRNIYRTKASGVPFYFLATIGDNITTTYTDNASDDSLSILELAPTANDPPPKAKYIEVFQNRVWLANVTDSESRIFFSSLTESETSPNETGTSPAHGAGGEIYPPDFWIDVEGNDGDEITGLSVVLDSLIIFKERSVWRLMGDNPENFELVRVESDMGCVAPFSIVKVENLVYFLSGGTRPSIAATDGMKVIPIGERVQEFLATDISRADMFYACGVRYKYTYVLIYTGAGDTQNKKGMVYDYIADAWGSIDGVTANVFSPWERSSDDGEVYFGSSLGATVLKYDTGSDDDGTDITSVYQSPHYYFGAPESRKVLKKLILITNVSTDSITVEILRDFNSTSISGESATFTAVAEFSDAAVSKYDFVLPVAAQCEFVSIKVSSTGSNAFKIYGWVLYYDEGTDGN